ncbi:MAG: hypothetical protein QGI61_14030 [Alphaproteobacteria bacterium]|jgi:hypothetical protein|nr:hypothetical protein [Alphaproteobacteria bacterium]
MTYTNGDNLRPAKQPVNILNSSAMTSNAAVVAPPKGRVHEFEGRVRMAIYSGTPGRLFVQVDKSCSARLAISNSSRFDASFDADAGALLMQFHQSGNRRVQDYSSSAGGSIMGLPAVGGPYKSFDLKDGGCTAVFDPLARTIYIDASAVLVHVPAEPGLELPGETDNVDTKSLATRLMHAQDELVKAFGDGLRYELDENGRIAGVSVSLA